MLGSGCRPSVREVARVVSTIPLGVSRDRVRQVLIDAYSKEFPDKASRQSYSLTDPPQPVISGYVDNAKRLIEGHKQRGEYVRVYPPDLFERASMALVDAVGLPAETAYGNGGVSLYYDANTNYIGFRANSIAKERR